MSAPAIVLNSFFDPGLTERQPLATAFLSQAILKGRLAHAYLFTGRASGDGASLAIQLAAFLNCSRRSSTTPNSSGFSPDELSCLSRFFTQSQKAVTHKEHDQYCQNCRWIAEEKHPQALLHLSTEGSRAGKISVEKTRNLIGELTKESTYTRIIMVDDANQEIFHRPAANAILKTIESPRTSCVFCLFALREEEVLPTVVSRCQVIPLRNFGNHVLALGQKQESAHSPRAKPIAADGGPGQELPAKADELWQELKGATKANGALLYWQAAKTMQDLSGDHGLGEIIDLLIEKEIDRFGKRPVNEPPVSAYLAALANLGEESKLQVSQFVSPKAVCESFSLSWWQLKNRSQLW